MKKFLSFVFVLLLSLVLVACDEIGTQEGKEFTVVFNGNGGTLVSGSEIQKVTSISQISEPVYSFDGYSFAGWDKQLYKITEDTVVKAVWKKDDTSFTITFDGNGGKLMSGEQVQKVNSINEIVEPVYSFDGYTFAGWDKQLYKITEDTVVKALWVEGPSIIYPIKFNGNGGKLVSGKELQFVSKVSDIVPPIYKKDGFIFIGWDKSLDSITEETVEVSAVWEEEVQEFTIMFDGNGGTLVSGSEIQVVSDDSQLVAPTYKRDGYIFKGWSKDLGSLTASALVKAEWEKEKEDALHVTFDANGGTLTSEEVVDVKSGTQIALVSDPVRDGYTFDGWYLGNEKWSFKADIVTIDLTLKAKWLINSYKLTILDYYGNTNKEEVIEYGKEINVEDPTRVGYTFTGYASELPKTMPSSDVEIQTNWIINTHTLTIKNYLNGNDLVAYYEYGNAITVVDPLKTGYTFTGYSTVIPETMPDEDIEIEANWTINKYTLTIKNYYNWTDYLEEYEYNQEIDIETLDLEGYTFNGYSEQIPKRMPAKDVTIEANWTTNKYKLTIKNYYGDTDFEQEFEFLSSAYVEEPTKEGYNFMGYLDGEKPVVLPIMMPSHDLTLTFNWEIGVFKLTLKNYYGESDYVEEYEYNQEIESIINPERTGYEFKDYSSEIPTNMPASDVTIDVNWDIVNYSITYDLDGGEFIDNYCSEYNIESKDIILPYAYKNGYDFEGWYDGTNYITRIPSGSTGNYDLVAIWTISPFDVYVTYQNAPNDDVQVYSSQDFPITILPVPEAREGFIWLGWYRWFNDAPVRVYSLNIPEDTTIYAKWAPVENAPLFVDPACEDGSMYTSLSEALDAAQEGQEIILAPGVYREDYFAYGERVYKTPEEILAAFGADFVEKNNIKDEDGINPRAVDASLFESSTAESSWMTAFMNDEVLKEKWSWFFRGISKATENEDLDPELYIEDDRFRLMANLYGFFTQTKHTESYSPSCVSADFTRSELVQQVILAGPKKDGEVDEVINKIYINKSIRITGPNANIHGHSIYRNEEANITATLVIAASSVSIDGLEFSDGYIQIGKDEEGSVLNSIYIKNCNIHTSKYGACPNKNINRRASIVTSGTITGLHIIDSSIIFAGSSFDNIAIVFDGCENEAEGPSANDISIVGCYFESTTKTPCNFEMIMSYNNGGYFNFNDNEVRVAINGYLLRIGYYKTWCYEINIIENNFLGNNNYGGASIGICKIDSSNRMIINVIGNNFENLAPSSFVFGTNGISTENCEFNYYYNYFSNKQLWKIKDIGNIVVNHDFNLTLADYDPANVVDIKENDNKFTCKFELDVAYKAYKDDNTYSKDPYYEYVVDDDWANLDAGTEVRAEDATWVIGTNAFASINDCLDAVEGYSSIKVLAGNYDEKITIDKSYITLIGPNASINARYSSRSDEAVLSQPIEINSGIANFTLNGFELTGNACIMPIKDVDGLIMMYCVINGTTQDGVIRSSSFDGDVVSNVKFIGNYSNNYSAYRVLYLPSVSYLEISNNYIKGTNATFDFLNVQNQLDGELLIKNNTFINSQQSFILIKGVGRVNVVIQDNYVENVFDTVIDIRNLKVTGAYNVFTITRNTFKNSGSGWCPIRIRTTGYTSGDRITVNCNYNLFIDSYYNEDDTLLFCENPSLGIQSDPIKVIYNMDYNYYEIEGEAYTNITADNFWGSALSWENTFSSYEDIMLALALIKK